MSCLVAFLYNITVNPILNFLKSIKLFSKKANIVILGLDNSGKTTLVGMLDNKEEIKIRNVIFNAHDLGGHVAARRIWKQYLHNINAIVFIVDSSDFIRVYEARDELNKIISEIDVPILVLGNKIDKHRACSESKLKELLEINEKNNSRIKLFMCSVVKRTGITEAFNWLSDQI